MIDNVDFNKIIVSKKVSFGKKGFRCFIGYKDNESAKQLSKIFPKLSL